MERSWQSRAAACAAAIVVSSTAATTGAAATLERTAAAADGVRLHGRWFEEPVRRAVQGAGRRLAEPACAAVLAGFRDASGTPLADRLAALAVAPPDYARLVLFYDGSGDATCRRPRVYAFTTPGSRVVHACPTLGTLAAQRPDEAEAVVIHEILHTLGLGDDRGSSPWVTAAVESRCHADSRSR